jgi:hypothetical protein
MNEKPIAVIPCNTMPSGMAFLMLGFVMLPKSGPDRTACLTVSQCGQIAGFGENFTAEWVRW